MSEAGAESSAASCETCGAELVWADCWNCDGEGSWHDCGEDCCPCRYPETQGRRQCPECKGRGGFLFCPAVDEHPHRAPSQKA
jgi:hypothetical protein